MKKWKKISLVGIVAAGLAFSTHRDFSSKIGDYLDLTKTEEEVDTSLKSIEFPERALIYIYDLKGNPFKIDTNYKIFFLDNEHEENFSCIFVIKGENKNLENILYSEFTEFVNKKKRWNDIKIERFNDRKGYMYENLDEFIEEFHEPHYSKGTITYYPDGDRVIIRTDDLNIEMALDTDTGSETIQPEIKVTRRKYEKLIPEEKENEYYKPSKELSEKNKAKEFLLALMEAFTEMASNFPKKTLIYIHDLQECHDGFTGNYKVFFSNYGKDIQINVIINGRNPNIEEILYTTLNKYIDKINAQDMRASMKDFIEIERYKSKNNYLQKNLDKFVEEFYEPKRSTGLVIYNSDENSLCIKGEDLGGKVDFDENFFTIDEGTTIWRKK